LALVRIRPLTPQDAAAFQQLRLHGLLESPGAFGSSHAEEAVLHLNTVAQRLEAKRDTAVFGAFAGETLIGLVGLGRERMTKLAHKAFVWGMYVAPDYRSQGAGRLLLNAALELARSVPAIRQVNLHVNAGNNAAIGLYESMGFQSFGCETGGLSIDGVLHDELHMALILERV
jgi:ribosomal protein S18 acetylase RimI-like enzyme